jgi:very-short-patch-repair endonuclease
VKVLGLNNKEYNLDLKKYRRKRSKCSLYHSLARSILKEIFHSFLVCEEVKIPGSFLYLDFFVPNFNLAVEVHGSQHFEYTPFFHKTKQGFLEAKHRDRCKSEWCEINSLTLVELRFDEDEQTWRKKINDGRR